MAFDFFLIDEVTGTEGGISQLFVAPIDWFTTIQGAPTTGTNPGDTATITAAHVFTAPHGWLSMPLIPGKEGLFKITTDGEAPNEKLKVEFEGNMSGLSAGQVEFMKQSRNTRFIALIVDGNCGNDPKKWNIGCSCRPARLKTEYSTEDNIWKLKGESSCAPALYDVAGAIPLEDDTP